jgi:hypothetical protein
MLASVTKIIKYKSYQNENERKFIWILSESSYMSFQNKNELKFIWILSESKRNSTIIILQLL